MYTEQHTNQERMFIKWYKELLKQEYNNDKIKLLTQMVIRGLI